MYAFSSVYIFEESSMFFDRPGVGKVEYVGISQFFQPFAKLLGNNWVLSAA